MYPNGYQQGNENNRDAEEMHTDSVGINFRIGNCLNREKAGIQNRSLILRAEKTLGPFLTSPRYFLYGFREFFLDDISKDEKRDFYEKLTVASDRGKGLVPAVTD